MATGKALVIVNPRSRNGADAAAAAHDALCAAGLEPVPRDCAEGAALPDLIREAAGTVDRVVVGGGDGTLNAAAPGLLDTGLPLGILPLGTANDLARTLGIPLDLAGAARVAASGVPRAVDLGMANDHPFFNVASIGLGVDLARALTRDAKRRWGRLGYAVAGLRVLSRLKPFRAEIRHGDAVEHSRTVQLSVGNGRHYGGGMTVGEDARIDDGRLDVFSLEVGSVWRLLLLLPSLRRGTHGRWQEVRTLAGEEVEVRTRRRRAVNTDGEITTHTPVRFRVLPGAVRVLVPAESG